MAESTGYSPPVLMNSSTCAGHRPTGCRRRADLGRARRIHSLGLLLAVQQAADLRAGLLEDHAKAAAVAAKGNEQAKRADHLPGLLRVDERDARTGVVQTADHWNLHVPSGEEPSMNAPKIAG